MAVIEITTFRLRPDVEPASFLALDTRFQQECVPTHRGFQRRTTARGDDGTWVVMTLWATEEDLEASAAALAGDDVAQALARAMDGQHIERRRYRTLD